MPKRIYVGSHAEVEVLLPSGEVISIAKGSSADFPDDMLKEMDVSDAWSTPTSTSSKAGTSEAKKEQ